MTNKTTTTQRIIIHNDDVLALLIESIKKKHQELSEDEFEVVLVYDTYNTTVSAVIDYIP